MNGREALKQLPLKGIFGGVGSIIGLGTLAYTVNHSLYNVDGGHRAVKYSRVFGVLDEVFDEGTHFRIPWIEQPIIYDVRAKPRNIPSLTGTKDLQMVNITLRVLSKPEVKQLPKIFRELGMDYDEIVLPSIVNETLKSVVAQFNAAQLITQRERVKRYFLINISPLLTVSKLVRDSLRERALKFNIILDDVSITHLKFGPEFTSAVEAKQIAQQEAQRAAFIVEKAIQEKQSIIVKAEGEAKATELIGKSMQNNPGFIQLRKIEVAREIANTLAHSNNKAFLSTDTLLLNVNKESLHNAINTETVK